MGVIIRVTIDYPGGIQVRLRKEDLPYSDYDNRHNMLVAFFKDNADAFYTFVKRFGTWDGTTVDALPKAVHQLAESINLESINVKSINGVHPVWHTLALKIGTGIYKYFTYINKVKKDELDDFYSKHKVYLEGRKSIPGSVIDELKELCAKTAFDLDKDGAFTSFIKECIKYQVKFDDIKDSINYIQKNQDQFVSKCYLPEVKIQEGKFTLIRLNPKDLRACILGNITGCCAHIGTFRNSGVTIGNLYPRWSLEDENSGNYVILNDKGKIVAFSFAYLNEEQNELVFNSWQKNYDISEKDIKNLVCHAAKDILSNNPNIKSILHGIYKFGDDIDQVLHISDQIREEPVRPNKHMCDIGQKFYSDQNFFKVMDAQKQEVVAELSNSVSLK